MGGVSLDPLEANERRAGYSASTAIVIGAVERAHWRIVKAAMGSMAVKGREARVKRPSKAEIIKTREDVMEYLLDGGVGSDFAEGVRQTLGWVLGVRGCPNYRDDGSSPLSVSRG
jgi:hypothetical protein